MILTLRALKSLRFGSMLAMLPATAYATTNFGQSIAAVSSTAWLGWALLSSLVGLSSMLHRLVRRIEDGKAPVNIWLFSAAQMFGAWAAGLFALFLGDSANMSGANTTLGIIVMSFGGAVSLQAVSDRWWSSKVFGTSGVTRPGALDD